MVQEGHLLAVFNSAHRVMQAEAALKALGVPVLLIPAPRRLQTDCGLALRFTRDDHAAIMATLEREELLPAFVSELRNGTFVVVWTGEAAAADQEEHA